MRIPWETSNGNSVQAGHGDMQELLVSSLAQTDALPKHLIEKGLLTQAEFMQKLSAGRTVSVKGASARTSVTVFSICHITRRQRINHLLK